MTNEELDSLEALAAAATRSPWHARDRHLSLVPDNTGMGATLPTNHIGVMTERDDAAFIAASRDAVPQLIAECRRLQQLDANWNTDYGKLRDDYAYLVGLRVRDISGLAERDALEAALREALDNWSNCREPDPYDKGARERIAELRQLLGDKP